MAKLVLEGAGGGEFAAGLNAIANPKKTVATRVQDKIQEITNKHSEKTQMRNADAVMWDIAVKYNLKTPVEIFRLPFIARKKILAEFCTKATEEGHTIDAQADTIMKMRYPERVQGWKDIGRGQSASAIVIADSTHMDWYDYFEQGAAMVEYQQIVNGIFGRRLNIEDVSQINIKKEVADLLYLIRNNQDKSLPLAPWVMFANVADGGPGTKEFSKAAMMVLAHRRECEKTLKSVDRENHQFYVPDPKHKTSTEPSLSKFRELCVVLDWKTGNLWVVGGGPDSMKEPTMFSKWAMEKQNLCEMLSVGPKHLENIRAKARELHKRMDSTPQDGLPAWDWLVRNVRSEMAWNGVSDEGICYKEACRVWRYATIERQVINSSECQKHWKDIQSVKEAIGHIPHTCCNDYRQMWGDIKVLGALLSREEFYRELEAAHHKGAKKFVIAPHYGCGFLGETIEIHQMFRLLGQTLEGLKEKPNPDATAGYSDYNKAVRYFRDIISRILDGEESPGDFDVLCSQSPQELRDALVRAKSEIEMGRAQGNRGVNLVRMGILEDRSNGHAQSEELDGLARFLYTLVVDSDPNSMMVRAVLRRGFEVGVLEARPDGDLVGMPAAEKTYQKLNELYGGPEGYKDIISKKRVEALIIDQVARDYQTRYEGWIEKLPREKRGKYKEIEIVMFLHNSTSGQSTIVPPEPQTREQAEDFRRQGYYNAKVFSLEEIEQFGMKEYGEYILPAA
ncbi:Uncharacterised protein [uncultured archaeon]|nr:Uncharacterised protein [uncultured archaeon]